MGTVLSLLCMIDEDVMEDSIDEDRMEIEFGRPHSEKTKNTILRGCSNLVSLDMEAHPLSGAYAYFSAATKAGYTKLIIHDDESQSYEWLDVDAAKGCYDDKTGNIGGLKGFEKTWFFCAEIPGKLPRPTTSSGCNQCIPCIIT